MSQDERIKALMAAFHKTTYFKWMASQNIPVIDGYGVGRCPRRRHGAVGTHRRQGRVYKSLRHGRRHRHVRRRDSRRRRARSRRNISTKK